MSLEWSGPFENQMNARPGLVFRWRGTRLQDADNAQGTRFPQAAGGAGANRAETVPESSPRATGTSGGPEKPSLTRFRPVAKTVTVTSSPIRMTSPSFRVKTSIPHLLLKKNVACRVNLQRQLSRAAPGMHPGKAPCPHGNSLSKVPAIRLPPQAGLMASVSASGRSSLIRSLKRENRLLGVSVARLVLEGPVQATGVHCINLKK